MFTTANMFVCIFLWTFYLGGALYLYAQLRNNGWYDLNTCGKLTVVIVGLLGFAGGLGLVTNAHLPIM